MDDWMDPGQPGERRPPPRRRREGNRLGRLTLILAALALILACVSLLLILTGRRARQEPEPETFFYGNRQLEVLEGVPRNQYDPAGFSLDQRGRVTYQEEGVSVRAGIDVSVHQGEIDWQAVAADGVDFAMIRLGYRGYTQGGLYLDDRFRQNMEGALAAGLDVGVYFFSQAVSAAEAEEEAEFVIQALEEYDLSCPVAFDWEFITPGEGARTDGMDGQTLTQCAQAFCGRVKEAGYSPLVYFNQHLGYLTYDLSQLTDYTFWLAEYDSVPDFYYHFEIWQYSNEGAVAGIQGNVDLNLELRREQKETE